MVQLLCEVMDIPLVSHVYTAYVCVCVCLEGGCVVKVVQ